ncbi:hypothetical protein [Cellvibrio mixtus]|uniref:hypothetical protein n=1 Tax=Cellvibrio mixtus TaxID=39650 RepID=UPI000586BD35|nr:hypothetical protein [Cellvibrio mixtus]
MKVFSVKSIFLSLAVCGMFSIAAQASAEVFESKGSYYGNYTKPGCSWNMVAYGFWGNQSILVCTHASGAEIVATKSVSYNSSGAVDSCTVSANSISNVETVGSGSSTNTCSSYRISRK